MLEFHFHYHLALGSGIDILTDVSSDAKNIADGWTQFWNETYKKENGLWLASVYLSSLITAFAFLGWAVNFMKAILTNKWSVGIEESVWMAVVMVMLADNGAMAVNVVKAMRFIAVEQTEIIYEINLAGVSIQEALTDTLVTSAIQDQIRVGMRACEIKTGQEQIDCLQQLGDLARQKIQDAERKYGALAGFKRLNDRVTALFQQINSTATTTTNTPQQKKHVTPLTLMLGSATQGAVHYGLKLCQLGFAHLFELSLAMTGLYCPIALSLSTLPLPTRFLWFWMQSFSSITVALWSYACMVGIIAWVIVLSGTQTYSDTVLLLLLGLCAPGLAWGLALGGGAAIWRSITSTVVTVIRAL